MMMRWLTHEETHRDHQKQQAYFLYRQPNVVLHVPGRVELQVTPRKSNFPINLHYGGDALTA